MALTTKRIIALPSQTDPQEGDYLAIDNAQGGTKKIPVGRIGVEVDDTLTEQGKAADAKAVGDALDEIRSQIEVTGTASGAIATFTDGADMPAKSVIVNIEPQQSGSGTPSPENVRPISGWTEVKTSVTGVNVWDEEWKIGAFNTRGEFVTGYNFICSKSPIRVFPNTAYTTNTNIFIWEYDADMNIIRDSVQTSSGTIFTTSNNAHYINFRTSQQLTTYNNDISINYPSTDHDYHAYNGTTTTTDLGRTVYGGTLDVVSGALTVDRAMVDLGTLTWARNNTAQVFWTDIPDMKRPCELGCSQYAYQPNGNIEDLQNGEIWNRGYAHTPNNVAIKDLAYTNAASFKTAMSGVQLVYELATPQTYQLTPTEVKTLLGENNVWADSGDVEVVYVRDLNIAINNLLNSNGTRSLGMMAMSAPTEATAEEPTDEQSDEQTEEPAEDDMR